jgi:hypothetical protein
LIIIANALLVGIPSSLIGLALRASGKRISHSGMIGATVGPLLGAAIAGMFWQHAASPSTSSALALSGVATVSLLAVVAALAAMRLGDSLELGAQSLSGPFVWFTVALSVASAERILWSQTDTAIATICLVGILLLASAISMATFERIRKHGSRPPRSFPRIFSMLVLGSIAMAFLPRAIPWVPSYEELPVFDEQGPPNILVVALGSAPDSAGISSKSSLMLLAFAGVSYEHVQPNGPSGVRELLRTPAGASVASQLAAKGYAAAAILRDLERVPELYGVEIDSAPGAPRLLVESFGWMASSPLLAGPGKPLLVALGLGANYRTPAQIAATARRWLTSWMMRSARSPFFLYVDFGLTDGPDRPGAVEAGLIELLEQLEQLNVDHRTAIVVASDPHARVSADSGLHAPFTAVLRPAADWPQSARGVRVHRKIYSRELGAALLEMADRDPRVVPRALPGQPDVVP